MRSKSAFVYILASKKNGTLYTGVTNNLGRRIFEHKHHLQDGFSHRYNVTRLVWFIQGNDIREAIHLEKKIKNRSRKWKVDLIEKTNPNWDDLAGSWFSGSCDSAQDDSSKSAESPASSCTKLPSSSCAKSQEPLKVVT
jgi:putative endonuclease